MKVAFNENKKGLQMSYSKKTELYRIPVMGKGDTLMEENEMQQMTIIDNLLYAVTYGCSKCLIEEGSYTLKKDKDGLKLSIKPLEEFSMLGILNYRLFLSKKEITYSIYPNSFYYIYAEYTEGLENNAESFSIKGYGSQQLDNDFRLLICTIDTEKEQINLDVEKVYAKNILAHTSDSTNPHGRILKQDEIDVKNSIKIDNNPVYGSIYADVISQGSDGIIFNIPEEYVPVFVTIHPKYISAGTIAWEIVGNDIFIMNSGNLGIVLHVKVEVTKKCQQK